MTKDEIRRRVQAAEMLCREIPRTPFHGVLDLVSETGRLLREVLEDDEPHCMVTLGTTASGKPVHCGKLILENGYCRVGHPDPNRKPKDMQALARGIAAKPLDQPTTPSHSVWRDKPSPAPTCAWEVGKDVKTNDPALCGKPAVQGALCGEHLEEARTKSPQMGSSLPNKSTKEI